MIRKLMLALAALLLAPAVVAQDLAVDTARVEDLRSIREIRNLQAAWGHLAIGGNWGDMADLATEDVVMVMPVPVLGRAALEESLRERQGHGVDGMPAGRLNIRLYISPVITLAPDGRSATGRWHHIAMIGEVGGEAGWIGTTDVIEYRLTDEGWKIARIRPYLQFSGPYATGWMHDATTLERAPYHYSPDEVGMLLPQRRALQPMTRQQIDLSGSLMLGASEALNVVNAYGYYLDRGMYGDIVDLFAPISVVAVVGQGNWVNHAGIRRYLDLFGEQGLQPGEMNDRLQLMPVVQISERGDIAQIQTIEIGMAGRHGGEGTWSASEQTFVLEKPAGQTWRLVAISSEPIMRSDYRTGWAAPSPALLPVPVGSEPDQCWHAEVVLQAAPTTDNWPEDCDFMVSGFAERTTRHGAVPDLIRYDNPTLTNTVIASGADISPNALDQAEAFDGAENVSNAYGYYIDQFSWANTSALFARDGWKELSYIGTFIGRDRVEASMVQRYGNGGPNDAFQAIHQLTQPYVTASPDGQRAQIRSRLLQMNSSSTGPGSWIGGIYENQVVKEDGIWRIHGMDLDYVWLADYLGGWVAADPASSARFGLSAEAVAAFAPDAPLRGETFAPFPRIAPMGFHFANPVSGREPDLRLHWSDGHRE